MTVLIEDTPRNNVAKWALEAPSGTITGAILSPFTTPWVGTRYKQSADQTFQRLSDGRMQDCWFDAATHALQMPSVGDFRYYDDWDLWGSTRGDLSTEAPQRDHLRRVFNTQDRFLVPRLVPTTMLHNASSPASQTALSMARLGVEVCRDAGKAVYVTVAGTTSFWSDAANLDAHVGGLAQLDPDGWFVVQVQPTNTLPVQVTVEEVYGLCRTVRSLSEGRKRVHVSHGDVAGLPAIAAGAQTVGSGWDTRQRACAYTNYAVRTASDGGGWFKRPTHEGLVGFLSRQEAELLAAQDGALSAQLVRGQLHPDGPQEAFNHHAGCLTDQISAVRQAGSHEQAFGALGDIYRRAQGDWRRVVQLTNTTSDASSWIDPFLAGLERYGSTEGW